MAWRAAQSLVTLFAQLKREHPEAAPPKTSVDAWGLIADAAHDPTSDHSPHDFSGWGNQIVTAGDFPNRPDLGLDAHKVLDAIRLSRDDRVKYGISNRQMFSSYDVEGYPAWTWRPYKNAAKDPHEDHGHLSVVGDKRADDTRQWITSAEDGIMELTGRSLEILNNVDKSLNAILDMRSSVTLANNGKESPWLNKLAAAVIAGTAVMSDAQVADLAQRLHAAQDATEHDEFSVEAVETALRNVLRNGVG